MSDLGTCLDCLTDLNPSSAMVSGRLALGQAIGRRLQTPRGVLTDDPNYGFYVAGYLNDDLSQADLGRIQSGIAEECKKDARVIDAACVVTLAGSGDLLKLTAEISLSDGAGPFTLVVQVTGLLFALSVTQ